MPEVIKRIYYPMLVSNTGTADFLTSEEDGVIWKKYITLPQLKQEILTDAQLPQRLIELQNKLSLSDAAMGYVSLMVRKIFFEEISSVDAVTQLNQKLSVEEVTVDKAQSIVQFIQNDLLSIKPKPKVEQIEDKEVGNQFRKTVKAPLLKAIAQYENLNYQMVTNEKIKIKGQPEPQRPSLANWIRYYRDELGVGFHDQVLRGRFLFQSENGKRLSNEERERINLILKSIEEDFPLDIDVEQGVIVFPTRSAAPVPKAPVATKPLFPPQENAVPARTVKPYVPTGSMNPASGVGTASAAPQSKPSFFASKLSPAKNVAGETLHFSTGHVLPGEKAGAQSNNQSAPATPAQAAATPQVSAQPTSPTSASPTVPFRSSGINQNRGAALPRSPYSIRPLRLRDDVGAKEE